MSDLVVFGTVVTDSIPKSRLLQAEYQKSDVTRGLQVPPDDRLLKAARSIEEALATEEAAVVREACVAFLAEAAEYYGVSVPQVRVLRARPIRARESGGGTELFGD